MTLPAKLRFRLLLSLLTPAVRFCLRHAMGVYELLEVVKIAFVTVAAEQLRAAGDKETVSRLGIITGLQRREVKRILEEDWKPEEYSNLTTRIIGQWEQDKRFSTKNKSPALLTFAGEDSEFDLLVRSVSKDTGPKAVLFDLERLGLVERVGDKVRLKKALNVYKGDPEKGLALLSRDTDTLAKAVEQNLFSPQKHKNIHVCTHYDNVFKSDIPKIRKLLYREGQLFHKKLRALLSRYDQDITPHPSKEGGARVSVVSFSWTEGEKE